MIEKNETPSRGLLFLDRDGVLNSLVIDAEQGTVDSPLHPAQVQVFPEVPELLRKLEALGFGLVVVTNQPAAAKGKTTLENLKNTHQRVLHEAQSQGARILCSEVCFHRAEDHCDCRKPKAGMLEAAWRKTPGFLKEKSWMIGDGVTDIQAGTQFGVRTIFLAAKKSDTIRVLGGLPVEPTRWCANLKEVYQLAEKGALQ